MRNAIRGLLFAGAAICASAPSFAAEGIAVPMDEARVIVFNKPVQTVFVGNPVIADVNMIDSRHAFILGKAFGVTNLIALDANGNPVASRHVTVQRSASLVTLNKGADQFTFACASRCETAPTQGDNKDSYEANMGQITGREDYAAKQADASNGH